jgi:hypothetical protein
MRGLQHVRAKGVPIRYKPFLDIAVHVAGEQERHLPVPDTEHE